MANLYDKNKLLSLENQKKSTKEFKIIQLKLGIKSSQLNSCSDPEENEEYDIEYYFFN